MGEIVLYAQSICSLAQSIHENESGPFWVEDSEAPIPGCDCGRAAMNLLEPFALYFAPSALHSEALEPYFGDVSIYDCPPLVVGPGAPISWGGVLGTCAICPHFEPFVLYFAPSAHYVGDFNFAALPPHWLWAVVPRSLGVVCWAHLPAPRACAR